MNEIWDIKKASNSVGEVYIYGTVTQWTYRDSDVSADKFRRELDNLGDVSQLNVYINSGGGSVFEGSAIYSILKRHKAKIHVFIDSIAASIASVIAMAGDIITMPENALMMIHNPFSYCIGNAEEMRKSADELDKIRESMITTYLSRGNLTRNELIEKLDAETWLSAEECREIGFCDIISAPSQAAASMDSSIFNPNFKNVPQNIRNAPLDMKERLEIQTKFKNILKEGV